jgi:hypothetical protein
MSLPDELQRYVGQFLMPNEQEMFHRFELLMWQLELLHDNLQLKHRPLKQANLHYGSESLVQTEDAKLEEITLFLFMNIKLRRLKNSCKK